MIYWKKKLKSSKFWVAMSTFVTLLLVAFGMGEDSVIIMAGADMLAYIIAEGMVDANSTGSAE